MGCGGSKQAMVKETHQHVSHASVAQTGFTVWESVLDFLDFRDLLLVAPTCRVIHRTTGNPDILRKFQRKEEHKAPKRLDTLTEYQNTKPAGSWFAIDTLGASVELTPKFLSPTAIRASSEVFRFGTDQLRLSAENIGNAAGDSVTDSLEMAQPNSAKLVLRSISEIAEFPFSPDSAPVDPVKESAHFKAIEEEDETDHSRSDFRSIRYEFQSMEEFSNALWKAVCEGKEKDLPLIADCANFAEWRQQTTLQRTYGEEQVSLLAVAVSSANTDMVAGLFKVLPMLDIDDGYAHTTQGKGTVIVRRLRPLQFACARGIFPIVQMLLEKGSDPDHSGITKTVQDGVCVSHDFGAPPLFICVNSRFYNSYLRITGLTYITKVTPAEIDYFLCAKSLLDAGASVDIATNDPMLPTPLFSAIDRSDMLKLLSDRNADPNVVNEKGHTPLFLLCERKEETESIKMLLDRGALVDPPTCRPLFIALSHKHLSLVKVLRHYGAQVNGTEDNPSALQVAVSANDAGLCRMILGWSELKIDWGYRQNGKNMFHRIAQAKAHEIFDLLVAHRSPEELSEISKALNQSTSRVSSDGDTLPVLYAFPDLKLVRKMVDYGSDIKRLNLLKCIRAYRGDKPVVQTLLDLGLDPNSEWEGQRPVWWAHEEGKTELITLLCKYGANVNHRNRDDLTLLMDACLKGNTGEVRILLRHGADALAETGGKVAANFAEEEYQGKGEDTKKQLKDLLAGWKSPVYS